MPLRLLVVIFCLAFDAYDMGLTPSTTTIFVAAPIWQPCSAVQTRDHGPRCWPVPWQDTPRPEWRSATAPPLPGSAA
jgi:hypothetical protein